MYYDRVFAGASAIVTWERLIRDEPPTANSKAEFVEAVIGALSFCGHAYIATNVIDDIINLLSTTFKFPLAELASPLAPALCPLSASENHKTLPGLERCVYCLMERPDHLGRNCKKKQCNKCGLWAPGHNLANCPKTLEELQKGPYTLPTE
jgi:hypothetical protein